MQLPNWLTEPWPWYVGGPIIGLTIPLLLILGNKTFGISSSLRHMCSACIPFNIPFFKYDWKKEIWNLIFVFGIFVGAFLTAHFFSSHSNINLNVNLVSELNQYSIQPTNNLLPTEIYNWNNLLSLQGFIIIVMGGFLVGFGTRYAGGCTSGHAIMGLSNLQWPSLVATCCFMIGGFVMANLILPFILKL
jgi:uncharacterized membrane protein YedE/YeeE